MTNIPLDDYNCGGFALGTYKWETPYNQDFVLFFGNPSIEPNEEYKYTEELREGITYSLINDELSQDEIAATILQRDVQYLLYAHPELEPITLEECAPYDRVIAYRICIPDNYDAEDFDAADVDFHFRVRINGFWFEKCGSEEIRLCAHTEEPWLSTEEIIYNSPIKYFRFQNLKNS